MRARVPPHLATDTKWNYGWTPTEARLRDVDRINNVLVENKESSVSRMGDRMSKKGTRVVFLCGQTRDGMLAPQTSTGTHKDKDTLVKQTWQSDVSEKCTTTSWAWQCGQQGKLRDHHNNFDKDMFVNWQVRADARMHEDTRVRTPTRTAVVRCMQTRARPRRPTHTHTHTHTHTTHTHTHTHTHTCTHNTRARAPTDLPAFLCCARCDPGSQTV